MAIDRSDLSRIAELARLSLSEAEAERLTQDCQAILQYFETIRGIGADGDESEAAERAAPLREDRTDCDPLEGRLDELAPAWRDGYFVLPRLPAMDGETGEDEP
jgi:aspartyl-tRNA(Asn)/glutamyl-tRNA(Gln) amidotransferase subunit C